MHPLQIARIVCKRMGLVSTSICSALLHDVVEDTEYTVEDIRKCLAIRLPDRRWTDQISGGIFGRTSLRTS